MYERVTQGDADDITLDGVRWWRLLNVGGTAVVTVNDGRSYSPQAFEAHAYRAGQRVKWHGSLTVEYAVADDDPFPGPVSALPAPQTASGLKVDVQSPLVGGRVSVDGSGVVQPVSSTQLPPALQGGRLLTDGSGVVQPVSGPLTDAQLAARLPLSTLPKQTGALTHAENVTKAPAANAVLSDTGPLGAGVYDVRVTLSDTADEAAADAEIVVEHRNAPNTGTLHSWRRALAHATYGIPDVIVLGLTLAANERIRVLALTGGAGNFSTEIDARAEN